MRKFIIRTLLLSIGLIITYTIIYIIISTFLNRSFNNKKAVFVWGDSQAYYGIDLKELSNTLGEKVYSSAHLGAGVYDFLLFTEQVPKNSKIIVSISKLVQIRRKQNDYNRSGLSLWALKKLYENNYAIKEIISIAEANLKPRSNISKSITLHAYRDSMEIKLPLSHFKNYYKEIPLFLEDKQSVYFAGINNLVRKNCQISFLEFPYYKDLENIESQSPIKKKTENFKYEIGKLFDNFQVDTIKINKERNIFKDLSHLNCIGAKDLSRQLGAQMLNQERSKMFIAH